VANIKSAKKRIKVIARRTTENRGKKAELNTKVKQFKNLINKKELTEASNMLPELVSIIDSARSHGIMHRKAADRKKSRLSVMLTKAQKSENAAKASEPSKKEEVKVEKEVESKPEAKKATAKKTTAKKTTAKKPATKKTTAKKSTAKKSTAKKTTKKES